MRTIVKKNVTITKHDEHEELYFFNTRRYNTAAPIHVESCGISHPDPEYYMERKRNAQTLYAVYVMEYVYKGKGYIECDGQKYTVSAGDCYLLGNELSHKYYSDKDDPMEKTWINLRGNFVSALVKTYGCDKPVVIAHADCSGIFKRLRECYTSGADYEETNDIAALCAAEFVITLAKSARKSPDCIEEHIKEYIDNGFRFGVTVSDLAKRFHLSQPYLISIFHEKFGITPKQYILQKKIWAAKSLLGKESCDMRSIAETLGFSSVYHFSSAFKKATGETPGSFRKKAKSDPTDNKA